jgi:1-deoxy-D-xylulose-5-phosphate synthase
MKNIPGPKLLHCITVKGKGYHLAEKEQTKFHAPGIFDKNTGETIESPGTNGAPKYQLVFGKTLVELAETNPKIVGITPAMLSGCSMNIMAEHFPDRTFDVGIAEQHALTFSAGLAAQGMIPYCNVYSTFLQRAYDQIVHDIALQKLPVVLCIDRAGLVGEDGATHQGAFDLAYLRSIPNMVVAAPMDETELRNMLYSAQFENGPYAIRYPRAQARSAEWNSPFSKMETGRGRCMREGTGIAILTLGHVGNFAMDACSHVEKEGMQIALYDLRFLKPLDEKLLHSVFRTFRYIITVEDGVISGGMGSAVLEFMSKHYYNTPVKILGIPDRFIEHGTLPELYAECGFNKEGIIAALKAAIEKIRQPAT